MTTATRLPMSLFVCLETAKRLLSTDRVYCSSNIGAEGYHANVFFDRYGDAVKFQANGQVTRGRFNEETLHFVES